MNESHSDEAELRLIEAARAQAGPSNSEGIGFDETVSVEKHPRQVIGVIRDYTLLEKLGEGGMGAVYRAIHGPLQKVVALKVLSLGKFADESQVDRFQREMRALGRLEHPHIVTALDAGDDNGLHYLTMQFVEGWDLQRLVNSLASADKQLAACDACEMARQAAEGLQHAFGNGLIHRDVKPSNLMLNHQGQIKILDMGLALVRGDLADRTLTIAGQPMGTLDYMAPEQAVSSHEVDVRADIYSLGATLYFLLCGQPPLPQTRQIRDPAEMFASLSDHMPRPPSDLRNDVGHDLDTVLSRMLAKSPEDRFETPAEVATALAPLCRGADTAAVVDRLIQVDEYRMIASSGKSSPPPDQVSPAVSHHSGNSATTSRWSAARRWVVAGFSIVGLMIVFLLCRSFFFSAADRSPQITLKVNHYRERIGENVVDYFGTLGSETFEAIYNDLVQVTVELDRPAYCYLFACNPTSSSENRLQRCFPPDDMPPALTRTIEYPGKQYFRLNDGVGQQAFFVVVSQRPLPPFDEWLITAGLEWELHSQAGVWQFDGQQAHQVFRERGQEVTVTSDAFLRLARRIAESRPGISVRGLAFPVMAK